MLARREVAQPLEQSLYLLLALGEVLAALLRRLERLARALARSLFD